MPIGERQIMLGYVHGGDVRADFLASMLRLHDDPAGAMVGRVGSSCAGPLVAVARNRLAAQFLDRGREQWLFMVDTDVVFEPLMLARLADAADPDKRPVVCGVVAQLDAAGDIYPVIYGTAERDEAGEVTRFIPARDLPADGVIPIEGCGAAFVLIHRSVLEAIRAKDGTDHGWFREVPAPGGEIRGEDLSFCLRAADAGFALHAHCGVRPGHAKTVILTVPAEQHGGA